MFRDVRSSFLAALTLVAIAAPGVQASCDSWTLSATPENYVSGNAMSIADPDGSGPLLAQLIVPNAFSSDGMPLSPGGVGLWNGTTLTEFGPFSIDRVLCSIQYNGQMVVGGAFGADTTKFYVVTGDGTTWAALGSAGGLATSTSGDMGIYALAIFNGNLVAAGAFNTIDGVAVHNIAVWNGTSWSAMGNFNGSVRALAMYNGKLYAGGVFSMVNGTPANNIASYDGATWQAAGQGVGIDRGFQSGPGVNALAVYDGKLFVGGSFSVVGGTDLITDGVSTLNIAAWNGSTWTTFGTGLDHTETDGTGVYSNIATLAVVDGRLYAGGYIDDANGVAVDGLAKWNGTAWSGVGSTSLASSLGTGHLLITSIHLYQNALVAAGFSFDDGSSFLSTFTPNAADFDSSGTVAVSDIFAFLRAWFAHSGAADIDNSGGTEVSDIFAFLRHWFSHC